MPHTMPQKPAIPQQEPPEPLYLIVTTDGGELDETTMKEVEQLIYNCNGTKNPVLHQANKSEEFAEIIRPMADLITYDKLEYWRFLVVLVMEDDGGTRAFRPGSKIKKFLDLAGPDISSYELLLQLLTL
ncbi:hypothetical protein FWG76_01870 [Candidatus Saccharibacteria bacterium]|nr:hypothetical protein [Candidatus Saccharibacteria bacterium]